MSGPLSEADHLLILEWKIDQDALCPGGCGHYLDETSEMDGFHKVERVTCDACAARDDDREDHKDEESIPGELTYVVRSDG